jgi:phosphatidylserine/phosphatidylglycerophosphate/cardiolipin synthase-like enzyme
MLFIPATDPAPLIEMIDAARHELRLQAQTLSQPTVLEALRRAASRGVQLSSALGPQAAYTLDANGRPLVPSRLFDVGPNGPELAALGRIGTVFINPDFSEFGADGFHKGRASHAMYLVADNKLLVLCTGPLLDKPTLRVVCLRADGPVQATAAAALHRSEVDTSRDSKRRGELLQQATAQFIVGPSGNQALLSLLAEPGATVAVSALDDGPALKALLSQPSGKTVVVERVLARSPSVAKLVAAGVRVRVRPDPPLDGTLLVTPAGRGLIASQRLTTASLQHDRELGAVFSDARLVQQLRAQILDGSQPLQ